MPTWTTALSLICRPAQEPSSAALRHFEGPRPGNLRFRYKSRKCVGDSLTREGSDSNRTSPHDGVVGNLRLLYRTMEDRVFIALSRPPWFGSIQQGFLTPDTPCLYPSFASVARLKRSRTRVPFRIPMPCRWCSNQVQARERQPSERRARLSVVSAKVYRKAYGSQSRERTFAPAR